MATKSETMLLVMGGSCPIPVVATCISGGIGIFDHVNMQFGENTYNKISSTVG